MLFNLKIAGSLKEQYLINAEDLISIADLSFRIKYDSAEKISLAIKNETLCPLYFHKIHKAEGQDKEILECYPFKID